ncbi:MULTISPECIES: universal stress protein [unclassified Luteococcus]|uniref:universal stress protein n=1 Tax=unclassified Luteococcus TaxID=2639923 RepID=UPI00313E2BC0
MSEQYTIVVGINGSSQSGDALRWAAEQADLRGGRVVALRTWRTAAPTAPPSGTTAGRVGSTQRTEAEVRESLARAVERALGPEHDVELRVVKGGRKKAFVDVSREADLIVLGSPRKMQSGPMFAHRLVYATHCPIVVMPPEPVAHPTTVERAASAAGRRVVRAAGTAGRPGLPPRGRR